MFRTYEQSERIVSTEVSAFSNSGLFRNILGNWQGQFYSVGYSSRALCVCSILHRSVDFLRLYGVDYTDRGIKDH
jgi:hypothetical protein